ncbi:hypothetical protein GPAL_3298 [Glaciecola pallidula DSM 14239 = ACAM 615]|uniref:Uncharacterized protein n=1 Tax=Brumicola pallidula DSM 14239 = ACAM 615 TaxID=1121922 RepID=K6Z1P5_9ALTE|nr:hypothetical protein GPAL_3298 [Glaciecola pallidula DSM 14239 = ACAM 615]
MLANLSKRHKILIYIDKKIIKEIEDFYLFSSRLYFSEID